ncbi:beta-phosphoglucomutase [Enterococcus ureasiticus]|uniref:Beta-phosphoglucomutase n=1 Tax=Enterococcus ureasiticus TaxID=903984 RepID=A0A1E5GMW8_9ENTE|nr:beta-phosphoglucomutase [Enterococcus ureasiticus]OEG14036.1 beta-phosphoglucomutase [Enterococcus ureasiticus]
MFKAVIFDLDGVITDTAAFHFVAWKKLGEKLGIELTESFNEELKGVDRIESLRRILALRNQELDFSNEEKAVLATEKNDYYVTLIQQITPNDLLPGISDLLKDLKKNHIKVGLASASKNAPMILNQLGLTNAFDTIVDPATLSKGKPDPEIFVKACEQLLITPSEAIGIEDAYSGVQAINDANMLSVGVGDAETLSAADYVFSTTANLTFEELMHIWELKNYASNKKNSFTR